MQCVSRGKQPAGRIRQDISRTYLNWLKGAQTDLVGQLKALSNLKLEFMWSFLKDHYEF